MAKQKKLKTKEQEQQEAQLNIAKTGKVTPEDFQKVAKIDKKDRVPKDGKKA